MGYTTEFDGAVDVVPPLNPAEIAYLRKFSQTRRMARSRGPYFVDGSGDWGQGRDADIDDYNQPPQGQPGLWCQWEPTDDGSTIEWNGGEKFYDAEEWMAYLIDHFLKPGGEAASSGEQQFADFTFDHVVNGTIEAQGERSDDVWRLIVHDNVVTRIEPTITWPGEETLPASVNGEQPAIVYLLWSNKHQMWWRPDSRGYTDVREEAGRYSEAEAIQKVVASSHSGILEHVTCMVAAPDNWGRS